MFARIAGWGDDQPPVPGYSVSPTNISFGKIYLGNSGTAKITISQTGEGAVTIDKLDVDNSVFALNKTGFTLNDGSSKEIQITFSPESAQIYSGILTIYSNITSITGTP